MKTNWKQTMITFILSAILLITSTSFRAVAEGDSSHSSVTSDYQLTNAIKASVKSVLNEQTTEGTRIGAVVRLYNEGRRLVGVPEYEVRVKTEEGIEYTLVPSAINVKNIQPKETVELSYMIVVDRYDAFSLTELSWLDVDVYVYPKEEKLVISIPISSIEWKGENAVVSDPTAVKAWGDTFAIPMLSASLEYKPVSLIEQNTSEGAMTIIGLLATNKSEMKIAIPDFRMDGKTAKKGHIGKRLEQGNLTLEPGEQRYLHYAIPVGNRSELKSLTILTSEDFTADDKTKLKYYVGRMVVTLPNDSDVLLAMNQLSSYQWNGPIRFDPLYKLIQPEVDISMVALQMHESAGGGFKAAVAKFKLKNRSDHPIPVPHYQAELMSSGGYIYTGTRQSTQVETLIPNVSYVIYYSFILPSSETGKVLVMQIMDGESVAPFHIPIAAFKTQVQEARSSLAFYPFQVNLNDWSVGVSSNSSSYAYKLNLDLGIKLQDEAVVDQSFSKLRVELADSNGKIMVSKAISFTGENRLVDGMQTISFEANRQETSFSLRLYETIDTPFGEAKRLIQTLQK